MGKSPALAALRHLLQPVVRLLLRNGVTWREFAEIGKEVFVDVARRDYGIQGRPTNIARVSLMTGLGRREVMRIKTVLAGDEAHRDAPPNRLSQILSAWHLDPAFLDADGGPALLPPDGQEASVATLLQRYAGDVPHGALLKELLRVGLVEATPAGYRVLARDYVRSASDPDLLRQGSIALHDHAATIAHNTDSGGAAARFERMATHDALPRRDVRAFQAFLEKEGQEFLERADAWLAAHAAGQRDRDPGSRSNAGPTVRTGVGIYLIHDDEKGERE